MRRVEAVALDVLGGFDGAKKQLVLWDDEPALLEAGAARARS
jgi:hypothetical protein